MPAQDELVAALSSISKAISETLELRQVFARVAAAARPVVPFDRIGILKFEGPDAVLAYAGVEDGSEMSPGRALRRSDFSPRLTRDFHIDRIDDAARELDPAHAVDREVLDAGYRSILRAALRAGDRRVGTLVFASRRERAFGAEHERAVAAIAELVALALEHDRLWSVQREHRRRSEALESLLSTLYAARDVKDVFSRISAIAKDVVPHDFLGLPILTEDRRHAIPFAFSSVRPVEFPEIVPVPDPSVLEGQFEFRILPDLQEIPHERGTPPGRAGYRASLRIPLRLEGKLLGGLIFNSLTPGLYTEDDVPYAKRIADHVVLALSRERLAAEQQRLTQARDRAEGLEARVASLTRELEARGPYRAVGRSKAWTEVLAQAAKVAGVETTVLLKGETGTGKEVMARFIHSASPRAAGPFVALNCAALPEQLLESELFGYEKGAFTGATSSKPGSLEQAAGGVLFLDEVGEMSLTVQAKLLRVLQEREFQRLGATRTTKADVRVLAATNRDLKESIARGQFREDLYYRLHVFEIDLPPLRDRPDDVLLMIEHFLKEIGAALGRPSAGVTCEARDRLVAYRWPGNVRELRNVIERALILCEGGLITEDHVPLAMKATPAPAAAAGAPAALIPPEGVDLEAMEKAFVEKALVQAGNNKSKAAKLLGLTRAQLYSRLEKYGSTS